MGDKQFGSIDRRNLHLRWGAPLSFCEWSGRDWRFSWRRMLLFSNWQSPIRSWHFGCRRYGYCNHRCWCFTGYMIDGWITICGFRLLWWYSFFDGKVPCPCDEVIAKVDAELEADEFPTRATADI